MVLLMHQSNEKVVLMHQCTGGGIVDASIVLQVLMHQAGIDAPSR
jgi:hypothetical protein